MSNNRLKVKQPSTTNSNAVNVLSALVNQEHVSNRRRYSCLLKRSDFS